MLNRRTRVVEESFNISFDDQFIKDSAPQFQYRDIFPTLKQNSLEPVLNFQTESVLTFDEDFDRFFGNVENAQNAEQNVHLYENNNEKIDDVCDKGEKEQSHP